MYLSLITIASGAAFGAILRWLLALSLNTLHSTIPYGTLAANWIGAYLAGMAATFLTHYVDIAPQWRLLIITGFLGGLTTFSSFSLEAVQLLQTHRWGLVLTHTLLHTGGSIILTILGMLSMQWMIR
ncbi:MAG: fluoride efflux transporter CrcB [Snodgrassella sp.]|nr:fluoride efflux transporter CrcB [Snodgrassella sp.]